MHSHTHTHTPLFQDKCASGEYENVEQLREDVLLLVNNAKTYNEDGSEVFQDAVAIWVCESGRKGKGIGRE